MAHLTSDPAISLDGFMAGRDQDLEHPLGIGGEALHTWHFGEHERENAAEAAALVSAGAYVMGRNMFGPGRGAWDQDWRGWWGEEPPYHAPVFVLTHHAREPLEMAGGTTFFFVTDGFESALKQASDVVGQDGVVDIAGGASTVRQALDSGALDELIVDISPVVLGRGESMFGDLAHVELTPIEVGHSPYTTHIRYRVSARPAGA